MIDYEEDACYRVDSNSDGEEDRTDLVPASGGGKVNYFKKVCLRGEKRIIH